MTIRDDLDKRVKEKLLRWLDDSQALYDMGECLDAHAYAYIGYCLFCALSAMLVKAGVSKAEACRMLIAMLDRTQRTHDAQGREVIIVGDE